MTERQAEKAAEAFVERQHSRKMYIEPIPTALGWGFGAFFLLYLLDASGAAWIPPWVQMGVWAAVGLGFWYHTDRTNRSMRAEVNEMMRDVRERAKGLRAGTDQRDGGDLGSLVPPNVPER
jgi:hypothetical protein